MKIDYMMFSHFDTDHCQGLIYVMEHLKVKNAIISEQEEQSYNFKKFQDIVEQKKINVIVVKREDEIHIDEQCSFHILFPEEKLISNNVLNNNSIVAKFKYIQKNGQVFSLLLTGDIEQIAENRIVKLYKGTNILESDILKVRTSWIKNIIN